MKKSLLFLSVLALTCACTKTPAPEGSVTAADEASVAFYGGEFYYNLESNCDWTVTNATVDVVPMSGVSGSSRLTVTVPSNKSDEEVTESFTVVFKNADGLTSEMTVNIKVPAPSLEYGGATYGVKYFEKDGKGLYWMTENLHYVPSGVTVSDNPAEGSMFYPYKSYIPEGETKVSVAALKDDDSINTLGYLYTPALALGQKEITPDNVRSFEGTQGICPEGWYIPTREDFFALCGSAVKINDESAAPEEDPKSLLWDEAAGYASVKNSYAVGFNYTPAGYVNAGKYLGNLINEKNSTVKDLYGLNSLSYLLCSTGHVTAKGVAQLTGMMSTFTLAKYPEGRLNVSLVNVKTGVSVRCVRK